MWLWLQVRLWGEIFSTTQQKLDVVGMAGGGRPTPQVAAVLGPLESLHRTLEGRIKVGAALCWHKGRPAASGGCKAGRASIVGSGLLRGLRVALVP